MSYPRDDVAALYVMPDGPYPQLVTEWYDEQRDARAYPGGKPVVAHPPCGPWGRLKFLCTKQDPSCGPHAVEMVRAWGGVLEHPSNSTLWRACQMPFPGELPDAWGGYTIEVRQACWGHRCDKPTWLYIVGVSAAAVVAGVRTEGVATHRITNGGRGLQLPRVGEREAKLTPEPFARWLVELAAQARKS